MMILKPGDIVMYADQRNDDKMVVLDVQADLGVKVKREMLTAWIRKSNLIKVGTVPYDG